MPKIQGVVQLVPELELSVTKADVTIKGPGRSQAAYPRDDQDAQWLLRLRDGPLDLIAYWQECDSHPHGRSIGAFLSFQILVDQQQGLSLSAGKQGPYFGSFHANFLQGSRFRLSRFVLLRATDGRLLIESPLSVFRGSVLHPFVLERLLKLAGHHGVEFLEKPDPLLLLLHSVGMLDTESETSGWSEDDPLNPLAVWETHDLYFHWRTRLGSHPYPVGATYRFGKKPQPSHREFGRDSTAIRLNVPAPDWTPGTFSSVLETRRTRRIGAEAAPIELSQLAEFFYMTGAARRSIGGPRHTYPSAGSVNELELYAVVHRCVGLNPGVYYYDWIQHLLIGLSVSPSQMYKLSLVACQGAGMTSMPDVHVIVTSRFGKLASRYESIAYALTLQNLGCLYQTMCLVASDMGLAACPVGANDREQVGSILNLSSFEECSVGDLLLSAC